MGVTINAILQKFTVWLLKSGLPLWHICSITEFLENLLAIFRKKTREINKWRLLFPLDAGGAVVNRSSLSKKGCTLGLLYSPKIFTPRAKLYYKSGQDTLSHANQIVLIYVAHTRLETCKKFESIKFLMTYSKL